MGETTGIAWTDATFNPWIGCTKVGPGCDHCYAEAGNRRWHQGANWGPGAPRARTSEHYWNQPLRWNRFRADGKVTMGKDKPIPLWVFCASQADVFDNEIPPGWREDLWSLIFTCRHLRWQLVTKRVGNVLKMLPGAAEGHQCSPADFARDFPHVGVVATMVDQDEIDRDIDKLHSLKRHGVRWTGLSIEPQIGPIDLGKAVGWAGDGGFDPLAPKVDWVICGGESRQGGAKARPFSLLWAQSLRDQCRVAGVPFFMKQIGSAPRTVDGFPMLVSGAGTHPDDWPEHLRVREMPRVYDKAA